KYNMALAYSIVLRHETENLLSYFQHIMTNLTANEYTFDLNNISVVSSKNPSRSTISIEGPAHKEQRSLQDIRIIETVRVAPTSPRNTDTFIEMPRKAINKLQDCPFHYHSP